MLKIGRIIRFSLNPIAIISKEDSWKDKTSVHVIAGRKASKNLVHEMSHCVDEKDNLNELTIRKAIGVLSVKVGVLLAATSAGLDIDQHLLGNETAGRILTSRPFEAISGIIIAGMLWGYKYNPEERRANKKARAKGNDILKFVKK